MAQSLSESELLALVDRLADGAWHSGEQLAGACGITRAALAKRIERLKDWQLAVEARHGLGYRLAAPIERLDAAQLQAALGERLRVRTVAITDSTNSRLLAAPAADDPQALLAEFQTAGRGRRGRDWVTPFAAQLALSVAWSFEAMPPQLTALPLAVGVVCAQRLRALGATGVQVKWPNDLVAEGRKLAGILIEHRGEGGGGCRVVVGLGLNLGLQPRQAAAVTQPWVNLPALLDAPPSRNALAADLLQALAALLSDYPRRGFAPYERDWAELDATRERAVTVQFGDRSLDGIARGIDADGALLVDAAGTRHRLHSGEVSLKVRS
ncbi:MAG: biotin--[acetyl-CoA-carboxylase] ligase [Pseudomonadota bacterium]|nr:biotin--[acetyl-CoA-carboxylase] ligase [Pseudomonadota bacterium]